MNNIKITTELSALGYGVKISKSLKNLVNKLHDYTTERFNHSNPLIIEQGCGLLRNVDILLTLSNRIVLVDTKRQIEKTHSFESKKLTIPKFISKKWSNKDIKVMNAKEFNRSSLNADMIFSINVFDVVPPKTREELLAGITKNISKNGLLVFLIPRNDTWTLRRCKKSIKYEDGYAIPNHGKYTFYHNWKDKEIKTLLNKWDFRIIKNFSNYRYVSLICESTDE